MRWGWAVAIVSANPAKAFNRRIARSPTTGNLQRLMRKGIRDDGKAAVLKMTKREIRSGCRRAHPIPIGPPQS